MYRTIMSFLGAAVLCFLAAGGIWGERETADAAVISVSPANVEGNIGEDDETTKTLQEIINDDATYVGAQDVLNFAPGEYEDVGELLVTRPLTLRKAPGSAGDAKFTGKVMINIKSDDVVVDGLTFMDVTVPDIVTIEVDRDPGTDGNQPIRYGFPGKTLAEFFKERLSNQQVLDHLRSASALNQLDNDQISGYFRRTRDQLPNPIDAEDLAGLELTAADMKCEYDIDNEEGSGIIYDLTDDSECTELTYNNELWVTVAGSSTAADNGQIANQHTGDPVSVYAFNAYKMPADIPSPNTRRPLVPGQLPETPTIRPTGPPTEPPSFEIVEQAITSAKAKNGLGIIWVDAYAPDGTCETAEDADGREVEVAEIKGVVIRNNAFDGTEIAAVRAGDWAPPGRNGVTYVIPGDRPGSPPSYNPPLRPSLRPSLRPLTERPFCQSIQCSERVSARAYCQKELDVVANTFRNVGGAGDFLKDGNGRFLTDDDGNKIAEVGNREPAIDLGNVVRAEITDNTIDGGTWDALVLGSTPEGARINIKNNLITNTILDGIKIYGPAAPSPDTGELEEGLHGTRLAPTAADAQSDTVIMVMGNRVTGTSMNRYITLHNGWDPTGDLNLPGTSDLPVELAYYGQRDNCFPVDEGFSEEDEDGDLVWTTEGEATANRRLAPEVWRSAVPTYTFPDTGGGVSNLNEDGTLANDPYDPWGEEQGREGIGYTGLVRISAESCVTSRVSVVYHQPGLSIIGNDLGYTPGPSVSGILSGSPSYGLTLIGDVALAAFSGNNIDFFNSAAVLSATGKAISTKGNYLGVVPRIQTGATTAFAAQDARESEPLGGTADAPRVIGPRESMLNPDRSTLMLTGVEVNAAGTMITLAYNKALRENSEIDPDDFTVRACTESSDCTGRYKVIEVTGVRVAGSTVTLSLGGSSSIAEGDTVVVIYSGAGIQDLLGNAAEAITTSQDVTNNVGRSAPTDSPGSPPTTNQPQAGGGGGGGCALASAGDGGANPGMLLPFMLAGLAFGMRRRRVGARRS